MINIHPLSLYTKDACLALLEQVFFYEDSDELRACLESSLGIGSHQKFLESFDCTELTYWIACTQEHPVVGTVGLYSTLPDRETAAWLGWFSVHPNYRQQGIGTQLLTFAIEQVRTQGKQMLKLYTKQHPNEQNAHRLYEQYGFITVREVDEPWSSHRVIYKSLLL